jgi:sec-independent protein translocase protein TatC
VPYILYQLWSFVAPGLYLHERRLARPLIISSTLLFFAGVAFAYYVVFPLVFGFFTSVAPAGVNVMTDISRYLDFVITLFFAFGFAFEVPVATILLVLIGTTTPEALAQKRPYIIVGAFVIGMLLTPPDVISQTLLALPMWLLFEVGLVMSKVMRRRQREAAERAEAEEIDDS